MADLSGVRTRTGLAARVLAATLLAALAVLATSQPAHAAGELQLSTDGVNWSSGIDKPIFGAIARLVPGDTESARIFVRNTGPTDGYLRVTMSNVAVSDLRLANALQLSVATGREAPVPTAAALARPCIVLAEGDTVRPGEVVALDALLAIGSPTGSEAMNASASFDLTVALNGSLPSGVAPTDCDPIGGGVAGVAAVSPVGDTPITQRLDDIVIERTTTFLSANSDGAKIGWKIMIVPAAFAAGVGAVVLASWRRQRVAGLKLARASEEGPR